MTDDDKRDDAPAPKPEPESAAVAKAREIMARNPRFKQAPNTGAGYVIPGVRWPVSDLASGNDFPSPPLTSLAQETASSRPPICAGADANRMGGSLRPGMPLNSAGLRSPGRAWIEQPLTSPGAILGLISGNENARNSMFHWLTCIGAVSETLPLWERVGVRGSGLSMERNPSPGSHLSMRRSRSFASTFFSKNGRRRRPMLSHKGRGKNS